jgi:hypothetical protein
MEMKRTAAIFACVAAVVLGTAAQAQQQGVAVLLHGARGGPGDFLIRNQGRFDRAGFETVIASTGGEAAAAARAAQQNGRRVVFVAMSRGVPRAAAALASGVKVSRLVLVSGVYEEAMQTLGSPGRLPPTLVVQHVADECPLTSPAKAKRFVGWAKGKASIRWINVRGTPQGRACGARHAHGFFQQDGPAIAVIIGFIRAR